MFFFVSFAAIPVQSANLSVTVKTEVEPVDDPMSDDEQVRNA